MSLNQTLPEPFWLAAFDPGERTGYCVVRVGTTFDPTTGQDFAIDEQGVLMVREVGDELKRIVGRVQRVTYETWRLYEAFALAMVGNDMQPSQVVGMIRYETWQQQKKIESHGAHTKKVALATMPDWLLHHLTKSSEQHDQDAIMHAWFTVLNYYHREQP